MVNFFHTYLQIELTAFSPEFESPAHRCSCGAAGKEVRSVHVG